MSKLFQSASVSFTTIFSASQQRVWRAKNKIQYQFYFTGTTWSLVMPILDIQPYWRCLHHLLHCSPDHTRVPEQPFMIIKCKKIWCCANREQGLPALYTTGRTDAGYLARSAGEKSFNFCGGMFRTVQLVFRSRQLSSPLYSTQLNLLHCSAILQAFRRKESERKIKCS